MMKSSLAPSSASKMPYRFLHGRIVTMAAALLGMLLLNPADAAQTCTPKGKSSYCMLSYASTPTHWKRSCTRGACHNDRATGGFLPLAAASCLADCSKITPLKMFNTTYLHSFSLTLHPHVLFFPTAKMVLKATGPLTPIPGEGQAAPELIKAIADCATTWQVRVCALILFQQ